MIDKIIQHYQDETFLKADGFDEAIIGVDETKMRLIYSVSKCIQILMKDMSQEDALEHFNFNVSGGCVGEKTPIWCEDSMLIEQVDSKELSYICLEPSANPICPDRIGVNKCDFDYRCKHKGINKNIPHVEPIRNYFDDLEKWENSFYCNECGCDEVKDFAYDRTVANGEVWHCKRCKTETVQGNKPNEDNY